VGLIYGAPGEIRTPDPLVRSLGSTVLYSLTETNQTQQKQWFSVIIA